jgi:uncharacterized protein (DUF1778 family)
MTSSILVCMTVQIALRLDDGLAESVRAAAAANGTNLSEWIRGAIRREAALATALRARVEEDARPPLYPTEQEDALLAARRRRATAAFTGEQ